MFSTDNDISWAWMLLGIVAVSVFTLALKHIVDRVLRSWQDRRATPFVVDVDDNDDVDCCSIPAESAPQSDTSGGAACGPARRDANTQVNDRQSYSIQELDNEVSVRLSNQIFPLVTRPWTPLARLYERRALYKASGAIYNGEAKQWSMPLGTSVRRIIKMHPEWLEDAGMLERTIMLDLMGELESRPLIR